RDILRLLPPEMPGGPSLSRETLDSWLSDRAVIRHIAFHDQYSSGDDLCGLLLGLPEPVRTEELDSLSRRASTGDAEGCGPGGWAWSAIAVLLWRYRYGLTTERILLRADCSFEREDLLALIDRSLTQFPFADRMRCLSERFGCRPGERAHDALAAPGLWQR